MGTFEQDYYAGNPAITQNQFGKGTAFYVGTVPDTNGMDWLMETVCEAAGVQPAVSHTPTHVEVVQRRNGESSWLFVLNHSSEEISVLLEKNGLDLPTGRELNGSFNIGPSDVAIVELK